MSVIPFDCAGIILLSGNNVLVVQGLNSKKWSFPKGHREDDENIHETAIRELREETGVELTNEEKYCKTITYIYNYGEGNKCYKYKIYRTSRSIIPKIGDPNEIRDVKWVQVDILKTGRYNKNRSLKDWTRSYQRS